MTPDNLLEHIIVGEIYNSWWNICCSHTGCIVMIVADLCAMRTDNM